MVFVFGMNVAVGMAGMVGMVEIIGGAEDVVSP